MRGMLLQQHEHWTARSQYVIRATEDFRALHALGAVGDTTLYSPHDLPSEPAASAATSAVRLKDLLLRVVSRKTWTAECLDAATGPSARAVHAFSRMFSHRLILCMPSPACFGGHTIIPGSFQTWPVMCTSAYIAVKGFGLYCLT